MHARELLDTLNQAETDALEELTPFRGRELATYEAERVIMKLAARLRQRLTEAVALAAALESAPVETSRKDEPVLPEAQCGLNAARQGDYSVTGDIGNR